MYNEEQLTQFFKDFENESTEKFKLPIYFSPSVGEINTIGNLEIEIKKKKILKNDSIVVEHNLKKPKTKSTSLF